MSKRFLLISGIFLFLVAGFFVYLFYGTHFARVPLPVLGEPGHVVGDFSFQDQRGDTITQKDLDGRVSVVEYFYTSCPGICPEMNRNMARVYELFRHTPGFQILSHTVNPSYDKVPVLAKYAEQYDADPRIWKFLTGPRSELNRMAVEDYLLGAADSTGVSDQFVHTEWWALVDKQRRIRGFYDGLKASDISRLEQDIRRLLREP